VQVVIADLGMQTHGHAIRTLGGMESDVFLTNTLVDMYAKCELVSHMELVFDLATSTERKCLQRRCRVVDDNVKCIWAARTVQGSYLDV
jgi:hypothetical protein